MSGGVPCSDVAFNMITLAVDGDLRKKQGKCISKETGWKAVAKTQIRYYSGLDWGGSSRARRRQLVWDVALRWCQQDFRPSAPSCKSPSPSDTALRKLNSFSCLRKFSSLLYFYFCLYYSHPVAQARNLGITLDSSLCPPPTSSWPPCPVFSPSLSPPPLPSCSPTSLRPGLCQVPLLWLGLSRLHTHQMDL